MTLDPTVTPVAAGTALLGAGCGAVGAFAVVRRRSLQADVAAHAALPGVGVGSLLGLAGEVPLVLAGAAGGWLALLLVGKLGGLRRVGPDAALAAVLATAFGLGLVLLTYLQRTRPGADGVRLQHLLLGQDAAVLRFADLLPLVVVVAGMAAVLLAGWHDFQLVAFDPAFAAAVGRPVWLIDAALTGLLVLAVAVGVQAAGVVLVSALVVAPGAAARQWANRLGRVVLLAAAVGGLAGFAGTLLAHALSRPGAGVPTGPVIVLVATTVAMAAVFAGRRA
jgi:manganese/zinc/iron transport system permease protein